MHQLEPDGGPLVLVGLRLGATMAATVAARRADIAAVVLWAPCVTGREFVREQRAFALLAHATAGSADNATLDWGPNGVEANGYVFRSDTVRQLSELDLGAIPRCPAADVLVLTRQDSPAKSDVFEQWERSGAAVERLTVSDYPAMIQPPLTATIPDQSISAIVEWAARLRAADAPAVVAADTCLLPNAVVVDDGVTEEAVWFDDRRFGILTRPTAGPATRAMIFLNNAAGNRVGPHGMVPTIARAIAKHGVASFRIDLAGVGDSELPAGRPAYHPYDLAPVSDVAAAVRYLRARGFTSIAAGGLCSAAFLAWHASRRLTDIDRLILINPQTFEWNEGDSLDVSPLQDQYAMDSYRHSARSLEKWRKLFRGEVDVVDLARVVGSQAVSTLTAPAQAVRANLGIGGSRSMVGQAVRTIGERGGRVSAIFSAGDPGIAHLYRELGGATRSLTRRGYLRVHVIPGSDHSFTPRWATHRLTELLIRELVD